jgi:hypothetical protein
VQPATYSVPGDIRATLVRVIAYMGGLGLLAVAAGGFFRNDGGPLAAAASVPIPAWTAAEKPYPAFELLMPEFNGSPFNYAILRRGADNARKDVMTWGAPAIARPYATVEIFRPGLRAEAFLDASSEIAARIIDDTVADDVKPAGKIESKFGPMPLVDFAIAPNGYPKRCLGFARAFDSPLMQIAGWYCSAGAEVVDRATVTCMIDRLTMVNADTQTGTFFARAEVKRTFCGQRSPNLAATPEREGHIAPENPSKLKSALRGRLKIFERSAVE